MLKHLKYCLSAQLVLTTLTYGDIYSRDQERAEELVEENDDDSYLVISDDPEESDQDFTDNKSQDNTYHRNAGTLATANLEKSTQKMCHFSFFGEMLYLKAYFQGAPSVPITNAEQINSRHPSLTSDYFSEEYNPFDLDFAFGFRVGFDFKAHWMGIENQLVWMRYHTSTHTNFSTGILNSRIYGSYWNRSDTEPCGLGYKINYQTKIDWDMIDLTSKIPLSPLKRITLSPKIGVRGLISDVQANIHKIKSFYGCTQPSLTPPQNTQTNKLSQKYNAIGLLCGFDSDIDLGIGFHFATIFNAAAVFGEVDTKNIGSKWEPVIRPDSFPFTYTAKDSYYAVSPIFDAKFNFSWKKECFNNKVGFDISIGYEIEYMPNFLQLVSLSDSGDNVEKYDFSMQGLNVGLGISF
ncbi:MAG: Lpg1974 family pore-forming outer membrane protein [Chlamydiae bacterium]|nr:Lpg1974 family pore-forming outer membrane protein [Chlamydiota bacterium]